MQYSDTKIYKHRVLPAPVPLAKARAQLRLHKYKRFKSTNRQKIIENPLSPEILHGIPKLSKLVYMERVHRSILGFISNPCMLCVGMSGKKFECSVATQH